MLQYFRRTEHVSALKGTLTVFLFNVALRRNKFPQMLSPTHVRYTSNLNTRRAAKTLYLVREKIFKMIKQRSKGRCCILEVLIQSTAYSR